MNIKKAIKKMAALGTGLTMIGATIMGASALDLSDYPAPFIQNNLFSGKIVVGASAKTADVLGAIDIAARMQRDAKTAVTGTSTTTTSVVGGVQLRDTNDAFTWGDSLSTFNNNDYDDSDFPELLADGQVKDKKGTNKDDESDYTQTISFGVYNMSFDRTGFDTDLTEPIAALDLGAASETAPLVTFTLQMKGSDVIDAVNLANSEEIVMFGTTYTFDASTTATGNLILYGSDATTYIELGTPKTLTVDGTDYEVAVIGGNADDSTAILSVDGDIETVESGTTYTIGGLDVYVQDLFISNIGGDSVSLNLFVGSNELKLPAGSASPIATLVEVNDDTIDGLYAKVTSGTGSGDNTNITKIEFLVHPGELEYDGKTDEYYDWLEAGDSIVIPVLGFTFDFASVTPAYDADSKEMVQLKRVSDEYYLEFTNADNEDISFEIFKDAGDLTNITHPFQIDTEGYAGPVGANTNMSKNQVFIVNGTGTEPVSYVFEVAGFTQEDGADVVRLKNLGKKTDASKTYEVGETIDGTNAEISVIYRSDNKVRLDTDTQDFVFTKHGLKMTILDVSSEANVASLIIDEDIWGNNLEDEYPDVGINVTVDYHGTENVQITGVTGLEVDPVSDKDGDYEYGVTPYGSWTVLETEDNGDYFKMWYGPTEAVYNFAFGPSDTLQVATSTSDGGSSYLLNAIPVGMAVLDSDAPSLGSTNLLVIGGPCANTVAAALMGNPANCAEGFEEGKAVITYYESEKALLVAGYNAKDTQGATIVLAEYEDYSLSGLSVEVLIPSLSSITVQAPTVD